ncbi:MAG: hypothetical protein ACI841_001142 [Planctomycetota bacterium]|jgi:hypothetical protein
MTTAMMTILFPTALLLFGLSAPTQQHSQAWDQGYEVEGPLAILPQRERAPIVNELLRDRLESILPAAMRETGIDMWVVINREYAEDPVYLTLVPEPVFAARRTTILVFFDRGEEGIERLTVSRYGLGEFYESAWEGGGSSAEQWQRLAHVITERNPKRIGINTSRHWAFGDGLSSGLRARLEETLGDDLRARLVSAENLCIRWLETRSAREMQIYPQVVQLARSVIAEAFSNRVITPGVTTTDDVAWFLRQRFSDLSLDVWFQPYCNVQRRSKSGDEDVPIGGLTGVVIERGDLVHTDVGIDYLRMCTDTQEMAYVLRTGESEVPEGIQRAMAIGNRWQDILTSSFIRGRTGNEILAATRSRSAQESIDCTVYSHPLGYFGHAAGPTIGMWDNQGETPVRGDWMLNDHTCYAIEGSVTLPIPEWGGQLAQIKLEQDGWFDGERVLYIGGRQTKWHVIR